MSDHNEAGVATQVREGGSYTIDPETGEARLVEPPSAPPPPPGAPAPASPETRQKKVK